MKNYIIILAIILASFTKNFGQLYNKGAQMVIENGVVLKVDGDFLNDANSNFKNDSKVIIKGNITNNQTMLVPNTGLWELSGTTNQSISGIYPLLVQDIDFNNSAGFMLNNGIKINNLGNFLNGLVASSDTYPLIFLQNATTNTPTDASHVVGPVAKEGVATFTYPVGDATKFQPIKAEFTQNTSGFLAKYATGVLTKGSFGTTGTEATALAGVNDNEYWDLLPFNEGNTTAQITLYWDGYRDVLPNDVTQRRVAHRVGAAWLNEGQSSTTSGTLMVGSVKSNLVSDWSPFALGFVMAAPLPIRLISFSGKKVETGNQLNWKTSTEINASHFEIERSTNGKSFAKIGEVKATGGPSEKVGYDFIDLQNSSLTTYQSSLYYRLKMNDKDGKYEYSKIIYLENSSEKTIVSQVYPNPAIDNFTKIDININKAGEWEINHFDLSGKLISTGNHLLNIGANTLVISDLVKGMNLIQISNKDEVFVRKVLR